MLKDAACVAYWRAADYAGGDAIPNGVNPGTLDARLGSGAGADAADPIYLPYNGMKYAYSPGVSGNDNISTPDSAALSIVGDIDVRWAGTADDWTPAAGMAFMGKYGGAGAREWRFTLDATTGKLRFAWSADGTAITDKVSSVAPTVADGGLLAIRATLDVDNGSTQSELKFYTKATTEATAHADVLSDSGWTQLGTTVTTAGVASIAGTTRQFTLPTVSGLNYAGKVYAAVVKAGINGTTVLDVDLNHSSVAEPFATFTEQSSNAATMTFNRNGTGRKLAVVDRTCFLLGTDDYFEVPDDASLDFAAGDSFTVAIGYRVAGTTTSQTLLSKKSGSAAATVGYFLSRGTSANVPALFVADGTTQNSDVATAVTQGVASTAIATRKGTATKQLEAFANAASNGASNDNTTGSLANADPLRIGVLAGGTQFADMVFFAAAVFNRVLTADEVTEVHHELLTGKFVVHKEEQLIWDDRMVVPSVIRETWPGATDISGTLVGDWPWTNLASPGQLLKISNRVYNANANSIPGIYRCDAGVRSPDHSVQATHHDNIVQASNLFGVLARLDASAFTGYLARLRRTSTGTDVIGKYVNGVFTSLVTFNGGGLVDGDVLRLDVETDEFGQAFLQLYKNGVFLVNITDPSPLTGTHGGIYLAAGGSQQVVSDDFVMSDLALDPLSLQWDVRVPLGFTEQLQWGVRVPVAPVDKQLEWDVRAGVGQQAELEWDVREIIAAALEAPWDVRVATALALDAIWDVREVMGGTSEIELQWAVRQATAAAVLLLWGERTIRRRCDPGEDPGEGRRQDPGPAMVRRGPSP